MSQDDKPIFPRSSDSSEEEKTELRKRAQLSLENEEKTFESNFSTSAASMDCPECGARNRPGLKFCESCGSVIKDNSYQEPDTMVYGPPPMRFEPTQINPPPIMTTTVYGPPPMRFDNNFPPPVPLKNNKLMIIVIIAGAIVMLSVVAVIIVGILSIIFKK